jgi:glyoxylase-like metal-dependent hydrolase (beta-lactamase superfamily II)
MKITPLGLAAVLLATSFCVCAQAPAAEPYRTKRLSERVLLLTEISPMENLVVAVATKKGIVVIDTTGSPHTAALFRAAIEKEFGRSDFKYVINTHPHWDHAWGNQSFPEASVIIHESASAELAESGTVAARVAASWPERVKALKQELAAPDIGSGRRAELQGDLEFRERILKGLSEGFTPPAASISFSDEMTLHMGDVSLRLYFFGRAHSGCDIFIHVPEEKILVTGDIFLDRGWLPLFSGMDTLDVPRWIAVLKKLFAVPAGFSTVIPGHREEWGREKLGLWKDYIEALWQDVNKAKAAKLTLEQAISRLPLGERIHYAKALGHSDEELQRFHRKNILAFWRQLLIPVIPMMEEILARDGMKAAIDQCRFLRKSKPDECDFGEAGLNRFGYQLLGRGDKTAAVELFRFIVELYPNSANAHDSLGEAFMESGDRERAIANYEKSLQLDPANANAADRLKKLREGG